MESDLSLFGSLAPNHYYNFWLFSLLKMNVRDDDYSRNATCALIYISTLLY